MSCNTTALAGYAGTISGFAGSEFQEWTMDVIQTALDATSFDSNGWMQKVPGLKSGTGTFKGVGATIPVVGDNASAVFKTKASGGTTYTASIIVTSVTTTTPVEGIVSWSGNFETCGEVTIG